MGYRSRKILSKLNPRVSTYGRTLDSQLEQLRGAAGRSSA